MAMKQRLVVLGGGESGIGAARLAKEKGWEVFLSDKGSIKASYKKALEATGIPYEEGRHSEQKIFDSTEVVKSPGIPDTVPLVQALRAKGIPVISEIEFAWRYNTAKVIAITGSNGKTTTTNLVYHLLKTGGLKAGMGGNVGNSFSVDLLGEQPDIYVLELSSFQLDGIRSFRPDMAILLNISPDHLDRYEYKLEHYIASKFRIIENQNREDCFIYNVDNTLMKGWLDRHDLQMQLFPVEECRAIPDEVEMDGSSFRLKGTQLLGKHNGFNAKCAIRAALLSGLSPAQIQEGLDSFEAVPHRMEFIRTLGAVDYINDTKATNVDSVFYALDAMQKPVIWIAGGQDKGNDYEVLKPLVREKVRRLICLGADNRKLITAFEELVESPILETRTAREAAEAAHRIARPGEVVLLSPACASFDLFENYAARGDLFRSAVLALQ
ncbi:MAG: UDP-N-acetylmuramoyl-L-alanine--D-glutamate ligase [Phaeodactylibacter sp.]|nr:UDP-N-acetylmuramoyl-L-alanine--D-glutamate ligase [Phaeodactylibacter sp.]